MSRKIPVRIISIILWLGVFYGYAQIKLNDANAQSTIKVSAIAWGPNGQQIAVGYEDGRVEIRSATGQIQRTITVPPFSNFVDVYNNDIDALAWKPDGSQLITGTTHELIVWDVVTGQLTEDLGEQFEGIIEVLSVSWNQDASRIMAFKYDPSHLWIWNANTFELIDHQYDAQMDGLIWDISRTHLAAIAFGGSVNLRNPVTFEDLGFADDSWISAAAWSPGAQRIVAGTGQNALRIWSLPSGGAQSISGPQLELAQTLRQESSGPEFPATYILTIAFSLSGNRVYSVSGSGEFAVWDANSSSQTPISTTQLPGAPITAAAFNAGGTRLAYGDSTGTLRFYDVPAEGANDVIALFNTSTRQANLFNTLANNPPADNTISFATGVPSGATGGQWVMGDWDGDGVETPGVYGPNGVFYHTNVLGPSSSWQGTWFGLLTGTAGNRPVAGRFDASVNHDCIGVTDSSDFPPYGTAFALYFTCNLAGGNPPKTFQWLSVLLPNSEGHSGIWEFSAGNFDPTVDAVDTIACRRGNFIAWTNTPPTTPSAAFPDAQFFGAPHSGTSQFVVGDWNSDGTDSFGLYYVTLGRLHGRNDLDWNSGLYPLDQQLDTNIVGTTSISATTWRLR